MSHTLKLILAYIRTFPIFLMVKITGKARKPQRIWWRSDSVVHNVFMLWKMLFWARDGVRFESSAEIRDGVTTYKYGTWEALLFDIEESVKTFRIRIPIRVEVPMLRLTTGHVIPASPYLFAIAFDTSQTEANETNPSGSFTRGTGASDYFGWINLLPAGGTRTCSGATWASNAMTQVYDENGTASVNGTNGHFYAFRIVESGMPSGAQTVTATTTAAYYMDIISFSGVDQTTPLDGNFDGAGNAWVRKEQTGSATLTVTGTTHVDNSVGIAMIADNGAGLINGSTNTSEAGTNNQSFYNTAAITPAGTCDIVVTDTGGAPPSWLGFSSAMQPVSAVGPTNLKTWDGLAKASIKTMDGLAIASVKTWNGLT